MNPLKITGCSSTASLTDLGQLHEQAEPVIALLKEVGGGMLGAATLWTLTLGAAGLLLSFVVFFVLRRLRAFRWEWRHAKWFRGLTMVVFAVCLPVCFGFIGFFEGILRASKTVLIENEKVTEQYALIGRVGGDLVGLTNLVAAQMLELEEDVPLDEDALKTGLNELRDGTCEIHVQLFLERLQRVGDRVVRETIPEIRSQAREKYPLLAEGTGERLLDWFLDRFGEALVRRAVNDKLDQLGIKGPLDGFLQELPTLAARSGDPATVAHPEIAAYLVEETLVAGSLTMIKSFVRGQQAGALVFLCFVIVVPVAFFQTAHLLWTRRRKGE